MKKLPWLLLASILVLFILVQLNGLSRTYPGDEQTYHAMASLITQGAVPYRDFFVSQPPLQLYVLASVFSMFGFSIVALKLIPLIAILGSAVLLYLTGKDRYDWKAALISVALFLFSYEVLSKSTFNFGVNLSLFFIALGFYLYSVKKNIFWGGIVFGIAGMIRFYAVIPVLVLGILLLLKRRDAFLKFSLGFGASFLVPNLLLLLIFKGDYYTPVIAYHFLKIKVAASTLTVFGNVLRENWMVLVLLLVLPFLKHRKNVQLPLFIALGYLLFVLQSNRIFEYYFIPMFYFAAMLSGYVIVSLLRDKKLFRYGGIIFLIVASWFTIGNVIFVHSIILGPFPVADQMASFIDDHATENTVLFGDVSTAPLLSMMTSRKLVGNRIDTNGMVFDAGVLDAQTVIDEIAAEEDVMVVARPGESIGTQRIIVDYLAQQCSVMTFYEDRVEGQFVLYRC